MSSLNKFERILAQRVDIAIRDIITLPIRPFYILREKIKPLFILPSEERKAIAELRDYEEFDNDQFNRLGVPDSYLTDERVYGSDQRNIHGQRAHW